VTLEEAFIGVNRCISLRKTDPADGREKAHTIDVKIPAGIREGQRFRLNEQGQPATNSGRPRDLYLRIRSVQYPYFAAKDGDLHYVRNLVPWEAVLGCVVEMPNLHGTARVKIKPGAQVG